jgi:hypothetical protein
MRDAERGTAETNDHIQNIGRSNDYYRISTIAESKTNDIGPNREC